MAAEHAYPVGTVVDGWRVIDHLPLGTPVWGKQGAFGRVWPWCGVVIDPKPPTWMEPAPTAPSEVSNGR